MYCFVFILGAKWQLRRKILTPAFHFSILKHFVDILLEEGDQMTKILQNAGGTVVKDLLPFLSEHTLNAICGKRYLVFILIIWILLRIN